jgi:ribose transport system substrate-binding protein
MRNKIRLIVAVMLMASLALGTMVYAHEGIGTELVYTDKYVKAPPYTIGFSMMSLVNSWLVQSKAEFEARAASYPDLIKEIVFTNADGSISKQIADVEDLIAQGVDAIVISAVSPTALVPVVERAVKEGIPVIPFSNLVETDAITAQVVPDQFEFGRKGAEWLVEQLGGKGKIVALSGVPGNSVTQGRWNGAKSVFDQHPGIEVLGRAYGHWAYDKGKAAAEEFLAAHPTIDGVWSGGGAMTRGAMEAFMDAGRALVPMTGEAENGFMKLWLEHKKDFDSIALDEPTWQAALALDIALLALEGKPFYKYNTVPAYTITGDQLEDYVRPDLSDNFWVDTHLPEDVILELYKN